MLFISFKVIQKLQKQFEYSKHRNAKAITGIYTPPPFLHHLVSYTLTVTQMARSISGQICKRVSLLNTLIFLETWKKTSYTQ